MEKLIHATFKSWEGGDVDVDIASEEKFMRERKNDVCLAVFAVGQEEYFFHIERINTYSGMWCVR